MELEYRRVSEGRTPDDLDFDPDTEAQIIESTRDCVLAIYAENADGVTTGNPVEGVVQGHQGRVISGESDGIGGRGKALVCARSGRSPNRNRFS
jgi:hypothetical protein